MGSFKSYYIIINAYYFVSLIFFVFIADKNKLPVLSIGTTIVFVAANIVFVIHLNRGIKLTIEQLIDVHLFTQNEVKQFDTQSVVYSAMAVLTLVIGIVALVVDFILCNARYEGIISRKRFSKEMQFSSTVKIN